jgi:hypothetical protein
MSIAETNLADIRFGCGQFVTVGCNGALLTSVSGQVFAPRTTGSHDCLRAVTFGRNSFWAIGDAGVLESGFAGPPLLLKFMISPGASRTLLLAGERGRAYAMQKSTDLTTASWKELLTFTNTQNSLSFNDDPSPDTPNAFYRLRQLEFAPNTISGRNVTVTIVSSDGIYARSGSYRFNGALTGNAYTLTALSPIASSHGTYTYSKLDGGTAVLNLIDATAPASSSTIYYADAHSGEVVTTSTSGGFTAHQFGLFTAD